MNKHEAAYFDIFCNNKLKAIHIDTYSINPYMLFSRAVEKDVRVILESGRFIVRRNDDHGTTVMNVVLSSMDNFVMRKCGEHNRELLFNIHNICFKILTVF